ncbi:hypothetical protein D9M73_165770 [compost metagenome]
MVPTLKKSTSLASTGASKAADGTSIMIPSCRSATGISWRRRSVMSRAWRHSSTLPTIGNMIRSGRLSAARSKARSCASMICGRCKVRRMPRTPRNGFSSFAIGQYGSGLSPPTSRVRTTSGRPARPSRTRRYSTSWVASSGACGWAMKISSVRNRPMPSAPCSTALVTPALSPMLANTSTAWPSMVNAG